MKKRILLFLLNRFGKKKENRDNGGKTVAGIGCLSAFLFGPFLTIFLFLAIIVLISPSKVWIVSLSPAFTSDNDLITLSFERTMA